MTEAVMRAIFWVGTGEIVRCLVSPPGSQLQLNLADGQAAVEVPADVRDDTHYMAGGLPTPFPQRPTQHHVWDWDAGDWIDPRSLAEIKADQWQAIKAARDAAVVAPVLATPYGDVDADAASIDNIVRAVAGLREAEVLGMAPASIDWTMADNSVVAFTPAQLAEVAVLLLDRGNAAHAAARALRVQLFADSTDTAAKVAAVAWSSTAL